MRTILFTWELGGGLGHIMQMRPLALGMIQRGYRVVMELRDLSRWYKCRITRTHPL